MNPWYTDRSRYMRGFECRWKRLLEYHAFGTGIVAKYIIAPLATGRYTHAVLEQLLLKVKSGEEITDWKEATNEILLKVLANYKEEVSSSLGMVGEEKLDHQLDLVVGMSHGYARSVLPFIQKNFEILEVEKETNFHLSDASIIWMIRPDFVAKEIGKDAKAVHDFKTTSYWSEDNGPLQWANSVQMMANAYVSGASQYYMHMLVKGNKKYPNVLTHAFYRPGNPPFAEDTWSANYTRAKLFSRVRVADYRSLPDWIWQADAEVVTSKFPLVGPYTVHSYTVQTFFAGVVEEESWWRQKIQGLSHVNWEEEWEKLPFQSHLDSLFPRTFQCTDFSGNKCQFYNLCHKTDETWKKPLDNDYARRTPNHPQEGKGVADGR